MADQLANFAYGVVATAPSPAGSGTTLVLEAGQGAVFPTAPFDLLFWPPGTVPLSTNAELARCSNLTGDTFTFTRAQYGTTARDVVVGWQVCQPIDANLLNQFSLGQTGATGPTGSTGPTGATGPTGTGMPISDPAGITTATQTPDPISGSNTALWVQFPSDASVMAWGLAGDSYPRVVFGADPTDYGSILLGDGTFDPTGFATAGHGAYLKAYPYSEITGGGVGVIPQLFGLGGQSVFGAILGTLAFTGKASTTRPITTGGVVGDLITSRETNNGYPSQWRCTTAGPPGEVWTLVSVVAPTDPITATYTPPNAGALWQDFSGGGGLWISTGTSSGDWTQVTIP